MRRFPSLHVMLAALACAAPMAAQQPAGLVTGSLIDRVSHTPVEGARISILGTQLSVNSDSAGRFSVPNVPVGVRVIQVRAIGYVVSSWMVDLREGQVLRQTFELEGGTLTVDSITVAAREDTGWRSEAGFEYRRRTTGGAFITREAIQQRRASTVAELIRSVPGIYTACRGSRCTMLFQGSGKPCGPEFFLDGYPATFATGPTFPVQQVRGVEIYRNRSDVPQEFQRPGMNCGVIAIWTIEPGTRLENH
jgi:hypothetical protein